MRVSAVDGNSIIAFLTEDLFVPTWLVSMVKYWEVPAVLSTTLRFSTSKLTDRADTESLTPVCEPVKLLVAPLTICTKGTRSPFWLVALAITFISALISEELEPVIANLSRSHRSKPFDSFLNSSTLKIFSAQREDTSVPLIPIGY